MVRQGNKAVEFVDSHIEAKFDQERVRKLIKDLDSDKFSEREAAQAELARHIDAARGILKEALESKPSPEVESRLKVLLARSGGNREDQRVLRAVRVLEWVGSEDAKKILKRLADGSSWGNVQAKESLARLSGAATKPSATKLADDETVVAVRLQMFTWDLDVLDKAMTFARPIDQDSRYIVFACPGDTLLPLMGHSSEKQNEQGERFGTVIPDVRAILGSAVEKQTMGFSDCSARFKAVESGWELEIKDLVRKTFEIANRDWSRTDPWSLTTRVAAGEAVCIVDKMPAGFHYGAMRGTIPDCHGWLVIHAVPLRKVDAPYINAFSYNVYQWLKTGPAGFRVLRDEAMAWEKLADPEAKELQKWVKTLSSGGQVRILGRNGAENPFVYWNPSGGPVVAPDALVRNWSGRGVEIVAQYRLDAKSAWESASWPVARDIENGKMTLVVQDGPWQEIAKIKDGEPLTVEDRQFKLKVQPAPDSSYLIYMFLEYEDVEGWKYAAGAIDKNGHMFAETRRLFCQEIDSPPQLPKRPNNPRRRMDMPYRTTTYCPGTTEIDHYVLLKRPRVTVAFEGIATKPSLPAGVTTGPTASAVRMPTPETRPSR
jgi:hypothetical protein